MKFNLVKGYSLVEFLVVVSLGIGVIAVGWGSGRYVYDSVMADTESEIITDIAERVKYRAYGYIDVPEITSRIAIDEGLVPEYMISENGIDIKNSWNSEGYGVDIRNNIDRDYFVIEYNSVPNRSCESMITRLTNSFDQVVVNYRNVFNAGDDAEFACDAGLNVIEFKSAYKIENLGM